MNAENIYAYKLKGDVKKFSSIREAAEKLEGVDNAILSDDVLTLELSPSASEYDIFCALNDMCLSSGLDFDYYEEAYYAIGGKLNPYINFMMGKCLYLLNKKKEAASYLHMAYELDGETIFEDEDPVFIQLAKQ